MAHALRVHTLPMLLGLLAALPSHGDLRARDPDVEEVAGGLGGLGGRDQHPSGTFETRHFPVPHGRSTRGMPGPLRPPPGLPESTAAPSGETVHHPARTGNWCAFVHHRMVTVAVLCGTEKHTVRSVHPCPSGAPGCQAAMYRLSTRPVYRQKQSVFTALQWRCCPGHGGHSCQETDGHVSEPSQENTGSSQPVVAGVDDSDTEARLQEDTGWEGSRFQQAPSGPLASVPHHHHHQTAPPPASLAFADSSSLLSLHHMVAAMMSQLQPVLDSFNRTLERLSREVEGLSRDLEVLRVGEDDLAAHGGRQHRGPAVEERLESSFTQVSQMRALLSSQRHQLEEKLHSQHALLQHNLSSLQTDTDHKIRQSHDAMQVSVDSLSESLEEVRQHQERLEGELQRADGGSLSGGLAAPEPDLREAIARLEDKALNTTAQLGSLAEDSVRCSGHAEELRRALQGLEERLDQLGQRSEVHFAETGLETEAARVAVLRSVGELATNLRAHEIQLKETESDVEYIRQQQVHANDTPDHDCDCRALAAALARLEWEVANVTELAHENRFALEDADAKQGRGRWAAEVEDLDQGLLQVKQSLAFEQERSRTLHANVSQLQASLLGSQQDIRGLRERDEGKAAEMRRLSASFSSLLKDAVRHADVLEVLLAEEVMEFGSWSSSQQEELSIPLLLEKLRLLQDRIDSHDASLASMRKDASTGDQMTSDDPVAFTEWTFREAEERNGGAHQGGPGAEPSHREHEEDYSVSDFWSLGKEVEELAERLSQLERQSCNCSAGSTAPGGPVAELQAEVTSLRQGLEEHLRTFQNVFSQTEGLASSTRTLDLDRLWAIVRKKEGKRRRGRGRQSPEEEEEQGGESKGRDLPKRRKRHAGRVLPQIPEMPVAFVASMHHGTNRTGTVILKRVNLNHGHAYNPVTGAFLAPETGLYLFLVTLDFGWGPSVAVLRRGGDPVASLRQGHGGRGGPVSQVCPLELQRGDSVRLELVQGTLGQGHPEESTFSGLLLWRAH